MRASRNFSRLRYVISLRQENVSLVLVSNDCVFTNSVSWQRCGWKSNVSVEARTFLLLIITCISFIYCYFKIEYVVVLVQNDRKSVLFRELLVFGDT